MKPGRFTQEQIIEILREQEAGAKTADVCRKQWVLHRAPWAQMKPGLILTADESWGSGQLRRTIAIQLLSGPSQARFRRLICKLIWS